MPRSTSFDPEMNQSFKLLDMSDILCQNLDAEVLACCTVNTRYFLGPQLPSVSEFGRKATRYFVASYGIECLIAQGRN